MTTLPVGPRIAAEAAAPRRRRSRVMLIALAISLLVHGAVAALLLWPAAGPRDAAGEGVALVVEIVGAAPQAIADTPTAAPTAAPPVAAPNASPDETIIEPPAAQPAVVEAPMVRAEPEPVAESVVEIGPIAELAAIEPAAGPPLESEPAETELAEPELTERKPELPAAVVAVLALPTPTPKPALTVALAKPPAGLAAAPPVVVRSVPSLVSAAPAVPGPSTDPPIPAVAGATGGAFPSLASVEPAAAPVGAAPGMDRAPLFELPGLDNPWPDYPRLARRRGQEGEALLAVTVLADGALAAVELRTSSGYALLDEAALEAVRRWRFLPALEAGQPVQAVVDVPVVFRLE